MKTIIEKEQCCGCHACYNACPVKAIEMTEDAEGFQFPEIQEELCINCGRCWEVCPVLHRPPIHLGEETYACAAIDPAKRLSSSSGGVFALLAEQTILDGGLVCGAAFDEQCGVEHILTDELGDLDRIKGTKYVQSRVGESYRKVKEALRKGKRVLFSGTPCQVAGLRSFLGENLDNLLTVDLICHGVPSPGVWLDYLHEMGKEDRIQAVNFRKKDPATKTACFVYQQESGTERAELQSENLYTKGFLQNLFLRKSCFSCPFKGIHRCSDLTIGDFWSASDFHPMLADGKGVSAVLVHSEKGKGAFERILPFLSWESASPKEAAYWNDCLVESVKPTEKRNVFFARWKNEELLPLLSEMTTVETEQTVRKVSFASRVLRRIKRMVSNP